jgi:two-component system chemotaxis response regulator CheB
LAASAGGVEALTSVIGGLPEDLPAAVLVVLHIAPIGPSVLPGIIGRHSQLRAGHPADGDRLEEGRVYVAPPDHHLEVVDGHVRVERGPRENGNRPAADPLFRSIAAFGERGAGVVLSGALDDGTAGLAAIKAAGGLTVVQDPEEAAFPGMPMNAVVNVDPEHVLTIAEIPQVLIDFAKEMSTLPPDDPEGAESDRARQEGAAGAASEFTCPDCGGTLWMVESQPMRFRCRVGHSFSSESLVLGKQQAVEDALWAAIVALEERADISRRLLRRTTGNRASERLARRYETDIRRSEEGAAALRRLATELNASGTEEMTSGAE